MSSFFDSGPLPDWKDIQQWLGKDIPWELAENWDRREDSGWLNDYIQKMMRQSKSAARIQARSPVQVELKQGAKYVDVKIGLLPDTDIKQLRLFATSEHLRLSGLPGDKKRVVRFPYLVYARSGKAVMKKERELLVRFKRKPLEKSEYELFIQN
ncbi:hypothetical protein [Cohnella boryungensis]|uniref:Hsp20/alpha crystallin family protein n=1 Tax=Cohnella boryungensis TaxID=768479 RepID=A0ABV8S6Y2_9BACL